MYVYIYIYIYIYVYIFNKKTEKIKKTGSQYHPNPYPSLLLFIKADIFCLFSIKFFHMVFHSQFHAFCSKFFTLIVIIYSYSSFEAFFFF